jgi:hypothetical protein
VCDAAVGAVAIAEACGAVTAGAGCVGGDAAVTKTSGVTADAANELTADDANERVGVCAAAAAAAALALFALTCCVENIFGIEPFGSIGVLATEVIFI